jgi:hypothetical protein
MPGVRLRVDLRLRRPRAQAHEPVARNAFTLAPRLTAAPSRAAAASICSCVSG